jgi:prophage regulatory protein
MVAKAEAVIDPRALLRLPQVLALFPVGRSTWWEGVRTGKFPQPVKLTAHTTAWRASEIFDLIAKTGVASPTHTREKDEHNV